MDEQLREDFRRDEVRTSLRERPFGLYLHVPFCATRCGYCDFNTYTPGELGSSASPQSWFDAVRIELAHAAELTGAPQVQTVFVGGGTPSLLGGDTLANLLDAAREHFPFADDAEITTESNPESTSPEFFTRIREAGFTRVSLGMQSAAEHVLAVLERTHTPGRALAAAAEARAAGFEHVNLDLIYGTPGERIEDLERSLDAALSTGVDHLSAYSLIVEDGTRMARKVRTGALPAPDEDRLAERYELIDARLRAAGFDWYEVSNWATGDDARCRHNLGYWHDDNWWGIGPGAHSHVGPLRWWNRKHPARYGAELDAARLPVDGFEELEDADRHLEAVMLLTRLRSGLPMQVLSEHERAVAREQVTDGLLIEHEDAFVLTDRGRLLADAVIRDVVTR